MYILEALRALLQSYCNLQQNFKFLRILTNFQYKLHVTILDTDYCKSKE